MKDRQIYIVLIICMFISSGIGAVVQYTFDSIRINSLESYIDLDNDIIESLREQLGRYENYKDTDGDGFSDFYEVYQSFTNPFNSSDKPLFEIYFTPMQLWGLEHNISSWEDYRKYVENINK